MERVANSFLNYLRRVDAMRVSGIDPMENDRFREILLFVLFVQKTELLYIRRKIICLSNHKTFPSEKSLHRFIISDKQYPNVCQIIVIQNENRFQVLLESIFDEYLWIWSQKYGWNVCEELRNHFGVKRILKNNILIFPWSSMMN